MREPDYTYQFRPVPLIQRDGVSTLGGGRSSARDTARRASYDAPREHVSAYLGESEVVSVTRRSERMARRSSTQLRLVPDERSTTRVRRERTRDYEHVNGEAPTRRRRPAATLPRSYDSALAPAYEGGFDYDYPAYEREDERPRRKARSERKPAKARRRPRRRGGLLRAIPQAIGGLFSSAAEHTGLAVVLVAVVFTVLMLFAPVRNLYLAHRRLETLQATYAALQTENESIRNELSVLQTREGIENEARERGYVLEGETKVVVDGLSEPQVDGAAQAIAPIELPDNRTWYIRFLDTVFGYEPEA